MVPITKVREDNAAFARQNNSNLVLVFVGGTAGIGAATLKQMYQMVEYSVFYVLGRSKEKFERQELELERVNKGRNQIIFLKCEVSLVEGVDWACKRIREEEKRVDFVCLSAGKVPFEGASYTKEGLEVCMALSYYTRIRIISNLLPLLQQSSRPRVLSVLAAGHEKSLVEDDLGLEKRWAPLVAVEQTTMMTSLIFTRFAVENPKVAFIHSYPGLVKTEIISGMTPLPCASIWNRAMLTLIRGVVGLLMLIIGIEVDVCGERQAHYLTSKGFEGGKAYRVDDKSEIASKIGPMQKYLEGTWIDRIWDHTFGAFDKIVARK